MKGFEIDSTSDLFLSPRCRSRVYQGYRVLREYEAGLGFDFAVEVHFTIQRAVAFPKAWPVIDGEIRRSLVRRFPFGVLYSEEKEGIFIAAVMNLHRHPEYWKDRPEK